MFTSTGNANGEAICNLEKSSKPTNQESGIRSKDTMRYKIKMKDTLPILRITVNADAYTYTLYMLPSQLWLWEINWFNHKQTINEDIEFAAELKILIYETRTLCMEYS